MSKKKSVEAENLQELENALTKSEQFIEDNQKIILIVVSVVVLSVVAYLGFKKFYVQPKERDAQAQMFMAQNYFEKDSFNLALNGDGNYLGFLDIIDEYGITKSANIANYYVGISYLHMGKFEEAIDYLNDFKTDDLLLKPIVNGAKGDAYLELGNKEKALSNYKSAYKANDNNLTAPIYMKKAADLMVGMDKMEDALNLYKKIKADFPKSNEGREADKYIAKISMQLKQ